MITSTTFLYLSTPYSPIFFFFFFNDTATTEIYTLSLHDALPICRERMSSPARDSLSLRRVMLMDSRLKVERPRSEEHTSELQSQSNLVCRLLLEKKKKKQVYKVYKVVIKACTNLVKSTTIYLSED